MTSFFDRLRIAGDSRLLGGALRSVAAVALCGLGSVAIAADTIDLPINANGSESEPFESDAENGLDLTLTGVVEKALQHNVSLVVQRFNRSRTQLGVQEALSIYDFNLEADASTSSSTSPRSSLLQLGGDVITSDEDQWNFSLTRLTPWGGTARVFFNNTRRASSDVNQQPNPQFILNLSAGISQPLLRGRGREVTERNILVARNDTEINREQFRTEVENVVVNVTDVYWSLVGAKEQLKVAEESLKLAKELHEMNRIQVDVGTKAPLEMVQSEAGVARREEDIIRRRQAVEDAEDQLRRQINFARGRLWELPIIPVTEPEIAHSPIDVPAAVDQAYKMRPDVNRLRLTNEVRKLDARVAKNNLMPRLDLVAGYGVNAVAGRVELNQQLISDTNYGDGLDDLLGGDFDSWNIGFNFSMPLENRQAKARLAQAKLLVQQGDFELEDLQGLVRLEVRRTARAVETAAKSIESAKVSSRLAEKNLDAERKRYENGLSTSFQVLEIQEDLSEARSSEVTAVIGYRQALTAFEQATGMLLETYGITLQDN